MNVRRIGVRFSLYAALLVRIAELQPVSVHAGYCTSVGDVSILHFQCRSCQSCVFITLVLRWPGYDILNDTLTCMPSANGCRTQVPWMGDVVVTYGSSAGLGRQKENSGFWCFDGCNWAVLSCSIEQLLRLSYEVIMVALEKHLLFPHFSQHYLLWVRICSPEFVVCFRTSWLCRWCQITSNAK